MTREKGGMQVKETYREEWKVENQPYFPRSDNNVLMYSVWTYDTKWRCTNLNPENSVDRKKLTT